MLLQNLPNGYGRYRSLSPNRSDVLSTRFRQIVAAAWRDGRGRGPTQPVPAWLILFRRVATGMMRGDPNTTGARLKLRPCAAAASLRGDLLILAWVLLQAATAGAADVTPPAGAACGGDLEALAPYMFANDAGARDVVAQKGGATFEAALVKARGIAATALDDEACLAALRGYLRTFRRSHLSIQSITPAGAPPRSASPPAFRILSANTALLSVPSFADQAGAAIAALLEAHGGDITERPNLIIDVRGNTGGSDWTYAPLLPLMTANTRRDVGAMLLATPANSAANRAVCALMAPDSTQCRDAAQAASAAMDRAAAGTFIPIPGERALEIVQPDKVAPLPRRIGVLIDARCGSTCEEFLLAARQSFKVKLFGQSTAGSLDYSNLRPFTLPSGKRMLLYATSRSLRLPQFSVDAAGIPPDQVLPLPVDARSPDEEIVEVQRVLESGQ